MGGGGCVSARRPVWGESSRVESVLLNLLVIAGKKVRRLHIAESQVVRMCLFFLVSQRCEGGWNCFRDIFTSSEKGAFNELSEGSRVQTCTSLFVFLRMLQHRSIHSTATC